MNPTKLTTDQRESVAIALGERTGMDVDANDVAIMGKWLFHNHPDYEEVDIYELPLPMCAEVWEDCKLEESLFGTKDPATLQTTIIRLES